MTERLLRALASCNEGRPPVWLLRQAGRYMPQFRAIRAKVSFMELCRSPELVAEVTLLPVDILDVDAAIIFSDILVVADALGVGVQIKPGIGPVVERPVRDEGDVVNLPNIDVEEALGYVAAGIRHVKPLLKVPLIGFCGAPFTVACYMVQGVAKQWLLAHPKAFWQLLRKITAITIDYLKMQVEAGADALQIFDSWAHILGYRQFVEYCLPTMKTIVDALRPCGVPLIIYCRGGEGMVMAYAGLKPAAVSVDSGMDLPRFALSLPPDIAVQGNFDPDFLYASRQRMIKEVESLLQSMNNHHGFIFNVGRGLKPDMSVDDVKALVETVHRREACHR